MTLRDILRKENTIDKKEIIYIASYVTGKKKEELIARLDRELEDFEQEAIERLISERKNGKPMAYITGKKEFFSFEFIVNSHVFIPRPETELIVEEAERLIKQTGIKTILDMGTGSGAIGITLAKRTGCFAFCVDISSEALFVAKQNALLNQVEDRVFFLCCDLFSAIKPKKSFELIVANLPYVSEVDLKSLPKEVRDYEPMGALLGGKDGLEVIEKFVDNVGEHLSNEGIVLIEVGKKKQARQTKQKLKRHGFDVEVLRDYMNIERIVKARWKSS